MKRLFYHGAAMAVLLMAGCQQTDEPQIERTEDSGIVNGALYFTGLEEYNEFLSRSNEELNAFFDTQKEGGFVSYADAYLDDEFEPAESRGIEPLIDDPVFSRMLNDEGIIKVGEWYIRVNKPEEKVYALHEDYYQEHYRDLVSQNTKFDNLLVFTTDDEVLEELKGYNEASTLLGRGELFCDGAPGNSDTDNRLVTGTNNVYQYDTFLRYYRYGIGFALYVQVKWRKRNTGNIIFNEWDNVDASNIVTTYQRSYEVKCGAKPGVEWNPTPLSSTVVNRESVYKFDIYRGGNKLSQYNATARVSYRVTNGSTGTVNAQTDQLSVRFPN